MQCLMWSASLVLASSLFCQPCFSSELERYLKPLIQGHKGDVAVAVKHLGTGEAFAFQGDQVMPTASLIKLPIMIEAYRRAQAGELDLKERITLGESDKVPGSGVLTDHFSAGTSLSLQDAIHLMIVFSDNTATNLVVDRIGIASVKETMAKLGLPETRLNSKVYAGDSSIDPPRSRKYGLGSTTATEMLRLLEQLHLGELADKAYTQKMIQHLQACREDQMLTRQLPAGTKVAHKSGAVAAVRCEAGIIYSTSGPVALCVLTAGNEDQSWSRDNAAQRLCGEVGLAVYQYFNSAAPGPGGSFAPVLRRGAYGDIVETLQRTLNARLDPTPGLAVDGDFGPATEGAVVQFQRAEGLPPSGTVGPAMWKKLAPLLREGPPVPEPSELNRERLPTQPADEMDGQPFITAAAWAIADAKTGQLLWAHRADERRDFASTTKIMTAHLVCKLAAKDPKILAQRVVFSRRADETRGSTTGIRAGESLTVEELLYGLMLPSGNDAAVALAEHLGHRYKPAEESGGEPADRGQAAERRFVAEMNRQAHALGMTHTRYANPNGLPAEGHQSTCRDLLRLSHAALKDKLLQRIVAARRRGVKLIGPSGYERNVVFNNTNRLLAIDGYQGVKTGTTTAAGACLVSAARRGDDQLLLVVLGAAGGSGRYADSRNLYRWAWRQRGHE